MDIKCVITDDEPIARKGLKGYIDKVDFLTLTGECEDAVQLNNLLNTTIPDLIFLDIEMPLMSGLDLLATLRNPPMVIITSAYERYAIKGYEFDVADYLLKPISFERFLKSVNKVHSLFEKKANEAHIDYIFVKSGKHLVKVFFKDILFIESMENYIVIHTVSSKETVYLTLKNIHSSLPDNFIQVHRSYIINMDHIQSIEGNQLILGNNKITIARNQREEVFNAILNNRLISR